jgi:hypothetical protein
MHFLQIPFDQVLDTNRLTLQGEGQKSRSSGDY